MRLRPFLSAGEQPRPFSEIRGERYSGDLDELRRRKTLEEIARLEGEAAEATGAGERKRLQCLAEDLRCALDEFPRRR